jgi:ketosteroid isomerase-like protein
MKKMERAFLIAVVLCISSVTFTQRTFAQEPEIKVPSDFQAIFDNFSKAYVAKDGNAVAQLFTEDGMEMANGRAPVRGRAAIEAFYGRIGGPIVFKAIAFGKSGDVGYIIGEYGADASTIDNSKFVFTLKKLSGKWLIMSAMSNSNRPPQPQSGASPPASH